MNRRIFFIGLLLFIFGVLIFILSIQQTFNASSASTNMSQNLALSPRNTLYVPIVINSTDIFITAYSASSQINFYIINSSLFRSTKMYLGNQSAFYKLINKSKTKGALMIVLNSSKGEYPYTSSLNNTFPVPNYGANSTSTFLANDTYYLIFQNPSNSTQNVIYYAFVGGGASAYAILKNGVSTNFFANIVGPILMAIGIFVIIYSFFTGSGKGEVSKEVVEEAYRELKKGKSRKRIPSRKKK